MAVRPALVISHRPIGPNDLLIWVAMITNAARDPWPGDIIIENSLDLGLIVLSKVRTAKISTIELRSATRLGRLDPVTCAAAIDQIQANLVGRSPRE